MREIEDSCANKEKMHFSMAARIILLDLAIHNVSHKDKVHTHIFIHIYFEYVCLCINIYIFKD